MPLWVCDASPFGDKTPMHCWYVPLSSGVIDEERDKGGQAYMAVHSKIRQLPVGKGAWKECGQ